MGTTASLDISILDIDNSEGASGNNTSLIESETMFFFRFSFVPKSFVDILPTHDYSIGLGFNFDFFLIGQTGEMSDIQMSFFDGLFSSVLPYMGTENFSTGRENNMCTSVMVSQSAATFLVNFTSNFLTNIVRSQARERLIENMEDTRSDFDAINNLVVYTFDSKATSIVLLTSWGRIELGLIKNNDIESIILSFIGKNFNDLGGELQKFLIVIVDIHRLLEMWGVV